MRWIHSPSGPDSMMRTTAPPGRRLELQHPARLIGSVVHRGRRLVGGPQLRQVMAAASRVGVHQGCRAVFGDDAAALRIVTRDDAAHGPLQRRRQVVGAHGWLAPVDVTMALHLATSRRR